MSISCFVSTDNQLCNSLIRNSSRTEIDIWKSDGKKYRVVEHKWFIMNLKSIDSDVDGDGDGEGDVNEKRKWENKSLKKKTKQMIELIDFMNLINNWHKNLNEKM